MTTQAHEKSRDSVLDPAYSANNFLPPLSVPASGDFWIYGESEYECFRLSEMRAAVKKARLKVGYPGEYREPAKNAFFHTEYRGGTSSFRTEDKPELFLNGEKIPLSETDGVFSFTAPAGDLTLFLASETVPAFRPHGIENWTYSTDRATERSGVRKFPDTADGITPPHRTEIPATDVVPVRRSDGLYDAGREIFAFVEIRSGKTVSLFAGESVPEAVNTNPDDFEQNTDLVEISSGIFRSAVPLAFRYLNIPEADAETHIVCHALLTPEIYRGAFAVPDRELNDIWMRAAYTLRLCTRNFLIDGVKRDRLPWCGDLRISLLGNAFTFADPVPVRDTLTVLGRAGIRNKHINGITDYTLWYIINHDSFQKFFGDTDFLARSWKGIVEIMDILHTREDASGFLEKDVWTLIDWTKMNCSSPLQMLYHWALVSAARLAERRNDFVRRAEWLDRAEKLKNTIRKTMYDPESGLFRDDAECREFHRHGNFLAILSGVAEHPEIIARRLVQDDLPPTGTPYMAAMEISALIRAGFRGDALKKLRALWGGMLRDNATTFFEAYDPSLDEKGKLMFYDRPFGLSLCHAWGGGPASLLPELFFGIRPLKDGWEEFTADAYSPFAPEEEMFLTVPTPRGEIELCHADGKLTIHAPEGCRFVSPEAYSPEK